LPTIKQQIQKG